MTPNVTFYAGDSFLIELQKLADMLLKTAPRKEFLTDSIHSAQLHAAYSYWHTVLCAIPQLHFQAQTRGVTKKCSFT